MAQGAQITNAGLSERKNASPTIVTINLSLPRSLSLSLPLFLPLFYFLVSLSLSGFITCYFPCVPLTLLTVSLSLSFCIYHSLFLSVHLTLLTFSFFFSISSHFFLSVSICFVSSRTTMIYSFCLRKIIKKYFSISSSPVSVLSLFLLLL